MTVVNDEREKMWLAALRCDSQAWPSEAKTPSQTSFAICLSSRACPDSVGTKASLSALLVCFLTYCHTIHKSTATGPYVCPSLCFKTPSNQRTWLLLFSLQDQAHQIHILCAAGSRNSDRSNSAQHYFLLFSLNPTHYKPASLSLTLHACVPQPKPCQNQNQHNLARCVSDSWIFSTSHDQHRCPPLLSMQTLE